MPESKQRNDRKYSKMVIIEITTVSYCVCAQCWTMLDCVLACVRIDDAILDKTTGNDDNTKWLWATVTQ